MFGYSSPVRSSYSVLVAAVLAGLLASAASAAGPVINVDMVPVGSLGNVADTTGFGAVSYSYSIGKFDVTAAQYTAFLNSVASTGDPNGAYDVAMSNGLAASGITQTPDGLGGYSYATANPNVPVNFVSFWNAARFVNWLQNGQPVAAEGPTTTEDGTYTITPDGIAANTIVRNPATTCWAITSENEWYKAAYFDPSLNGGAGGYWQYPTRSNTAPSNSLVDAGNNANYYKSGYTYPGQYLTDVGYFGTSPGPWGTYDQGGDVTQWNDSIIISDYRGLRGGSWANTGASLKSTGRNFTIPTMTSDGYTGFRVVLVPEPASLSILAIACAGILARRRRRA